MSRSEDESRGLVVEGFFQGEEAGRGGMKR